MLEQNHILRDLEGSKVNLAGNMGGGYIHIDNLVVAIDENDVHFFTEDYASFLRIPHEDIDVVHKHQEDKLWTVYL